MAINIKGPKTPKISVTQGDQGVAAIIVRSGGGSGIGGADRLSGLKDVNVVGVQSNQTIFYNDTSGTYDARFINLRYDSTSDYVDRLFAGAGITIANAVGHGVQPVLSLTPSGVVAGTYGSNVSIPVIVVDTYGRINTISNLAITSNILPLSSNTGIYFNKETGVFYLGQNVDTTSNVTFNNVNINNLSTTNSITAQSVSANVWSGIYTANVVETSGNLYLTNARVRTALTVNDQGGDGSLTYNNANGQFTYIGPSSAEVRAHLSSIDRGGDGSFNYDQANGIFTYTGPSPTEARAHLAGSNGVYYNNANGVFNIGQNVDTTSNVTFNDVTVSGKLYSNDITFNDITVSGNLTVTGTTTSINTDELNIADNKIVLNSDWFGSPSQSAGVAINRGTQANVELLWDESLDVWKFTNDGGVYYLVPTSTTDLIEGTNLYYTNARARASVSINDQGGDGSITYNAANGQFTYIGPSPTEVRAHLSTSTGLYYNNANGVFHLRDTAVTPNTYGGSTKIPVITIDQQGRITNAANIDVAGVTNFTAVGNTFTIFTADGNTFSSSIQQNSIVLARDTTGPYVANLIASTGVSIFNLGDENSVPTISIGQNVYSSQAVVFANVAAHTFTGNLYGNNITTTNKISANSLSVTNDITAQTITGTNKVNANSLSVTNDITAQTITANVWSGIYTANVVETSGNLYFTNARVRTSLSVNDQGGDGSFTYNNANGQFTYIGPSPTEVRAHLAGSNGVYYNNANGVFNIGQNVDVTSNVTFNNVIVNGTLLSNDITADTITVKGNLIVDGSTTTVNTEEINLADNKILLNSNHIGVPSQDGGIIINRGNQANVDFIWNETKDIWEFTNDGATYWPVPTSTTDLKEGANLYYTTARVLTDTGPTFERANAALAMANLVYGSSNVKVGTVAGVNNTSISNVVLAAGIQQTGILNTSNVIEGSNLYYTTARVLVDTANAFNQANTARNLANAVYNQANLVYDSSNVKVGTVAGVNNTSISNVVLAAGIQQTGILNTSNVIEGSNLYYTTARVLVDTANAFNQANTARNLANAVYNQANLVYDSSNVKVGTVAGVNNTSISNVVLAAGVYQTGIFNTSNVIEGSNLYYTTARVLVDTANAFNQANTARNLANAVYDQANLVYSSSNVKVGTVAGVNNTSISNVVLAAGVQQTGILNTSNVIEGSNLYYTTARVLIDTANAFNQANTARNLANAIYDSSNVKVGTVAGVNATSISNVVLAAGVQQTGILNTSNVIEGSNLYYTTARVLIDTANAFNQANTARNLANAVYDHANLVYSSSNVKVGTVAGVNNTSISNVVLAAGVQQTGILNTSNVVEGSNLYFTTQRVRNSITANSGAYYNSTTGTISIGQNVDPTSNVTFNNLNLTGNLNISGNGITFSANTLTIQDPLIQLGYGNPGNSVDIGFVGHFNDGASEKHAGLFRDATDGKFKFFTGLVPFEPGDTIVDTANNTFSLATVAATTFEGNLIGNVTGRVSTLDNFTTSNVIEGANLYYTTARVLTDTGPTFERANAALAMANLVYGSSNVKVGTVAGVNATSISNVVLAAGVQQTGILNTSNVIEGANLYYTTARVLIDTANAFNQANTARNLANAIYNSSNVKVGTVAGVNATSISNVVLAAGVQQTGIFNTSNVIEGSNLYYTTARVLVDTANVFEQANTARTLANVVYDSSNVKVGTVAGVNATSISNVVLAAGIQQTGILNTSNVIEGANLYYTTARVLTDTGPTFERANAALAMANLVYGSSNVKVGTVAGVNATSISNVVLAAGVQQTGILNTSNVIEGSNLYYTTARVLVDTANVFNQANTARDLANAVYDQANLVYSSSNVKVGTVAGVNNTSISNVVLAAGVQQTGIFNTSNVIEGANLYYTTARVLTDTGPTFERANAALAMANLVYGSSNVKVGTVAGVNATSISNVVLAAGVQQTGIFNTSNVIEGSNLYYTNARVRATIFANSGVYYNESTGTFGIGQNVDTTSNVTFNDVSVNGVLYSNDITAANVTVNGNLTVTGTVTTVNTEEINLADNKILLNSNFAGTPTENGGFIINRGNLANTEFIWNEFDDRWEFTNNGTVYYPVATNTTDLQEGANLYYTNARARLAISANSNILYNSTTGTISLDSNVLTTANVVESLNRLYYTNARVITAVQETSLSNITVLGNVAAGNINITGRITGDGAGLSNVSVNALIGFTTQNVTEVVNLYFTNTRARAAISVGSGLLYDQNTGVLRVNPNSQGGGGADFAASLIYSQP